MNRDKYERILQQFELYYPMFYKRTIDWWGSGRMSIMVELNDGTVYDYDAIDNSVRLVDTIDPSDESLKKSFGANLQKMIPFTGLTKSEFAEQAGITNTMLSRYIRGNSSPSITVARRLACILRCSVDDLFDNL